MFAFSPVFFYMRMMTPALGINKTVLLPIARNLELQSCVNVGDHHFSAHPHST